MKLLYPFFALLFLITTNFLSAQTVTTLAEVTANGGVTLDADGNLYVAHFGPLPIVAGQIGRDIYKISPEGEVSLFVDGELNVGSGNHIDSQGFLYQSNFLGNNIIKIDVDGKIVDPNFVGITGPVGITVIENDVLVVCECSTNTVKKVTQTGEVSILAAGSSFSCVNGITQDGTGNVYTTNFSDGRITQITPDGTTTTLGTTPAGNGHIAYRSNDEHFYIASYSANRIYKMSATGEVSLFAGTGAAGAIDAEDPLAATFTKPNGIEISHDGCSLYITQDNNVIREIIFTDSDCVSANYPIKNLPAIAIYPNPTQGILFLENKSMFEFPSISILNARGQRLMQFAATDEFDLSKLNTGIYFLKLESTKGDVYIKKIVLKK